jgi:hypothetical protein
MAGGLTEYLESLATLERAIARLEAGRDMRQWIAAVLDVQRQMQTVERARATLPELSRPPY